MEQQDGSMRIQRFVNDTFIELQQINHNPIYGYQDLTILPLENTLEQIVPLVPNLMDYVFQAKKNCYQITTVLTHDESAAIYLYTMGTYFFVCLNKMLRDENRQVLKPWFAFLKLLISALEKLPSIATNAWRGVGDDTCFNFKTDDEQIWWSFNSFSKNLIVVQSYISQGGTLFTINTTQGKDISLYSAFPQEEEVILMPGTKLCIKSLQFRPKNSLLIVQVEEKQLKR